MSCKRVKTLVTLKILKIGTSKITTSSLIVVCLTFISILFHVDRSKYYTGWGGSIY